MIYDYREFFNNYAGVICVVSVIILYLISWYRRPKRMPPGPRGIPFLGFLPFLDRRLEKSVYALSKQYGKIITVRMGRNDTVFLNDFESIYKAFVKNGETLSGRIPLPQIVAVTKGNGLASVDYGPKWKTQRKFGLMTLRGFGVGKKQMENICLEELGYLNEEIRSHNGKPFDISPFLHNAVANNICGIALGQRFDYNDEDFYRMVKSVTNTFKDKAVTFCNRLIMFSPILRYVPPISFFHQRFLNYFRNLNDWVQRFIGEHEKTFDENNIRDFIDAFIVEKRKGKDNSFENVQLLHYIVDLFIAGTETTSSTLSWSLLCMLHFPETQKKLRKEIMRVVGSSGTISMAHKADMPYTNAFMQEVFRYRTLGPFGIPHKANADTELNDFIIPKETTIIANIWAAHNDPNLFQDPEKFIPERFLDEEGNFINSNHVIPFSVGPRHCLGEHLSRMEVFIFLVGIVQKFKFLPDPKADQLPSIDDGATGVAYVPTSYSIIAKEL